MRKAAAGVCAAALLIALPASAEVYKWVDSNGVTNYSNERPPASVAARALNGAESRVSVYSPDPGLLSAVDAMREQRTRAAAFPPAVVQYAVPAAPPPTPYEQCLASGRVGCDRLYGDYYPAWYSPLYTTRRMVTAGLLPRPVKPVNAIRRESPIQNFTGRPAFRR